MTHTRCLPRCTSRPCLLFYSTRLTCHGSRLVMCSSASWSGHGHTTGQSRCWRSTQLWRCGVPATTRRRTRQCRRLCRSTHSTHERTPWRQAPRTHWQPTPRVVQPGDTLPRRYSTGRGVSSWIRTTCSDVWRWVTRGAVRGTWPELAPGAALEACAPTHGWSCHVHASAWPPSPCRRYSRCAEVAARLVRLDMDPVSNARAIVSLREAADEWEDLELDRHGRRATAVPTGPPQAGGTHASSVAGSAGRLVPAPSDEVEGVTAVGAARAAREEYARAVAEVARVSGVGQLRKHLPAMSAPTIAVATSTAPPAPTPRADS